MQFNYQISEPFYSGYHSDIAIAIFSEQDFTKAYEIYHSNNFNYQGLRVEQEPYARYFRAFHHTDIHKQTYSASELENKYQAMIYFDKNRQFEPDTDSLAVMSHHIPYNYDFYGYTSLQYLKTKYPAELNHYHESNFANEEFNNIILIDYFEGWRQEHNLSSNIDIETPLTIEDSIVEVSILGLLKGNIPDEIKQKIIFPEGITPEMQQELLNNNVGNKVDEFSQNVIAKLQRLATAEDTVSKIESPYQYIESRVKEIAGNRVSLDQQITVIISKRILDKCKPKANRHFDVCKNQPKPITKYFTVYDFIRNIHHKEFNKIEYSGKNIQFLLNSDVENVLIKLQDVTGDYEKYINRFRNNEDVKYYINEGINQLPGSTGTTVDEFLDKYIEHMDEISYTESEIMADYYLNILRQILDAVSMILPVSPIKGYLVTITANTVIPLIQSAIANTYEESSALQQEAWVNFTVSSTFHVIFSNRAIGRKITNGAKLIENGGGYITDKFNIKKINVNYGLNAQLARESVKKIPGSGTNPWKLENIRNRYKSFLDRKYWSRFSTEKKIKVLQSHLMKTQEAKELAEVVGWEKLNKMIKDSIILDYEGNPINKIPFRKLEDEVTIRSYALKNDRKRINDISNLLDEKLTFSDQLEKIIHVEDISGSSDLNKAANWIVSKSTSNANDAQHVTSVLSKYIDKDISDFNVLTQLHDELYRLKPGANLRHYRGFGDQIFPHLESSQTILPYYLTRTKSVNGVDPFLIYSTLIEIHPFGDGNGRTARAAYALAYINKYRKFQALTRSSENILTENASKPKTFFKSPTADTRQDAFYLPRDKGEVGKFKILDNSDSDYMVGIDESNSKFNIYTAWNKNGTPATSKTAIFSAHGGRENSARPIIFPKNKNLIFWAPDEYRLDDPLIERFVNEFNKLNPHSVIGGNYEKFWSAFPNRYKDYDLLKSLFTEKKLEQLKNIGNVIEKHTHLRAEDATGISASKLKNSSVPKVAEYQFSWYEKDKEKEYVSALIENRKTIIRANDGTPAVDLLSISPNVPIDKKVSIKDLIEFIKEKNYDNIHVLACREIWDNGKPRTTTRSYAVTRGYRNEHEQYWENKQLKTLPQSKAASSSRTKRDTTAMTSYEYLNEPRDIKYLLTSMLFTNSHNTLSYSEYVIGVVTIDDKIITFDDSLKREDYDIFLPGKEEDSPELMQEQTVLDNHSLSDFNLYSSNLLDFSEIAIGQYLYFKGGEKSDGNVILEINDSEGFRSLAIKIQNLSMMGAYLANIINSNSQDFKAGRVENGKLETSIFDVNNLYIKSGSKNSYYIKVKFSITDVK
ncbi:Fic family protein [Photorhabdus sp. P32]|uniref:putative adhesin n=1 Tax=Photorhabdus sp. P32 TaxID=3117549 RepID=UPI00311B13F1